MTREQGSPPITLRIILEEPPPGVDIGLQRGGGSAFEVTQRQRGDGQALRFECHVPLRPGRDGRPGLGGPFVHGPRGGRFLYLDVGTFAGQQDSPWSRRIKVPLPDPETLGAGSCWQARIPGRGGDGSPACGTIRPVDGWRPWVPENW